MSEYSNLQDSGRAVHLINLPPTEEDVATILALLAYTKIPMSAIEISEANLIPLPSAERYLSQLISDEKIKMVVGNHSAGYALV